MRDGLVEIPAIVALLYEDVDEKLHKPAGRSVLAHLVKLVDDGAVRVARRRAPTVEGGLRGGVIRRARQPRKAAMSSSRSVSIAAVVSGLTRQTR